MDVSSDLMIGQDEAGPQRVSVARWPSEIPLLVFVALASAGIWLLLCLSILGIVYGLMIGFFLFIAHVAFIAHVRGSAVRLGPEQFPEIHQRVVELAGRIGLDETPEAYLMQEGGALNAFATRFLRSDLMVLYSDLLDACGDDEAARDMIIGHELGHIKAGHLRWMWLLAPGRLVPFLGTAYSRARELTCDRYGSALCGDPNGAARGLAILAAGGSHARRVNLSEFVRQRQNLDTGWMTLAKWLSGYPPLAERVAVVQPDLASEPFFAHRGAVRAILILASIFLIPMLMGIAAVAVVGSLSDAFESAIAEVDDLEEFEESEVAEAMDPAAFEEAATRVYRDSSELAAVIRRFEAANNLKVEDMDLVQQLWELEHPDREVPMDPFDGLPYGLFRTEVGFSLYSSGPDQIPDTEDDIVVEFEDLP